MLSRTAYALVTLWLGALWLTLAPVALGDEPDVGPATTEAGKALSEFLEHHDLWREDCWQPAARARFGHLIATPPDPIESQFARDFDIYIGALRRGLEAEGYVMDRHYLPWKLGQPDHKTHRDQPGLLFFRKPENGSLRILTVFLVGESPASGVHDGAFQWTLDQVANRLRAAERTDLGCPAQVASRVDFKMLSPFFSGSRYSLQGSLNRWLATNNGLQARFEMISGTATNPGNATVLSSVRDGNKDPAIDYRSVATNDRCLLQELSSFLVDRLADFPQPGTGAAGEQQGHQDRGAGRSIAFLVESSTYGSFFEDQQFGWGKPLVLPFPMHISHLRSGLDEQRKSERAKQDKGSAGSSFFSLGDRQRGAEAFPLYAPGPTAHTQELALSTIVRTIAQEKVQAVGIIASDVRDKLFLAEIVRQAAPDVRLFTTEGDLLLAHPDFREGSRGMIVASSRSLRSPDPIQRVVEGPGSVELRFASDHARGVFEAARELALALESQDGNATDGNATDGGVTDGDATNVSTESLTVCSADEKVWISVIGNGDLWPLELRGSLEGRTGAWTIPHGWSVLFYFASGGVLAVFALLGFYFAREVRDRDGDSVTFWQQWLRPEGEDSGTRGRARHLFLCLLAILVTCPYFVVALPILESSSRLLSLAAAGMLAVLCLTIVSLVAALWVRTISDWRSLDPPSVLSWGAAAAFAPVLVALSLSTALVLGLTSLKLEPQSDNVSILLLERSVAISSGVSPLLPTLLVLVVPVLWLLMSLSRHHALNSMPFLGHRPNPGARWRVGLGTRITGVDLKRLVDRVCLTVDPSNFFDPWRLTAIVIILLVMPFTYLMFYYEVPELRIVRGLEAREFDYFVTLGIGLAILLILGAFWRFAMGWRALSRLTDGLKNLRFDQKSLDKEPLWWAANRDRIPAMVAATPGISLALRQRLFNRVKVSRPATKFQTLELELQDLFADHNDDPRPAELAKVWEHVMEFLAERGHRIEASSRERIDAPERQPGWLEAPAGKPIDDEEDPVLVAARSFFAMETAFFVNRAVSQLRQLLTFSTIGLVLVLLTVSIYPFEPQRVLFLYVWSLIATSAVIGLLVLFQMERDEVISWISGSEPQKVKWDRGFIFRFVSYAGLPILALLANQFPQIRDVLFQFVEPITKLFL